MKPETKYSIDLYVSNGVDPGDFLFAVLTNDLMGAMGKADFQNLDDIFEICLYVYNEVPALCWGNKDKVWAWMKQKQEERDERNQTNHE